MSDFLKYMHNEQIKKMTEEERLALHKKKKLQEASYSTEELEDDDFYEDDETRLVEAHRVTRTPPRRPMPAPAPAPMPQEPEYEEPYEEPAPEPVPQRRTRRQSPSQMAESFCQPQMNPVLSEAYALIDEMKNKMEMMFFKYGMTGLERLNECMIDVCDEIMNPPTMKPVPRPMPRTEEPEDFFDDDDFPVVTEKVLPTKKKPVAAKQPVRKPVKKVTTVTKPIAKPVAKPAVASKPKIVKSEEEVLKEKAEKMNAMLENADFSELGNTLVMQSDVQVNAGANRKAEIEARGKALEEKMTKKTKPQQKTPIIENEEPVEDLEVVPDGMTTLEVEEFDENSSLETAVLDNPA